MASNDKSALNMASEPIPIPRLKDDFPIVTPCYVGKATHLYQEGPTARSARKERWVRGATCGADLLALPGERCILLCKNCIIKRGLEW